MYEEEEEICETKADNEHFAHELNESKGREVSISFFVDKIHEVSDVNQSFTVRFTMYISWELKAKEDIEDIDKTQAEGDDIIWNKKWFKWDPQIRFLNIQNWSSDDIEWYRVSSNKVYLSPKVVEEKLEDKDKEHNLRIIWARQVQGVFGERFEMKDFPYDMQHLHLGVTSRWDHDHVKITFDENRQSTTSSEALLDQTWKLGTPRYMCFKDGYDKESLPLLSQSCDSASGKRYCRAYLALTIIRQSQFVMWNIVVIMFLVGTFSFSVYSVPYDEAADRISIILTLVLTTVAFKFVTATMIPKTPYLTLVDCITYCCLIFQALVLVSICIVPLTDDPKFTEEICFYSCGAIWIFLIIIFVCRVIYLNYYRLKYVKKCKDAAEKVVKKAKTIKYQKEEKRVSKTDSEFRFSKMRRYSSTHQPSLQQD